MKWIEHLRRFLKPRTKKIVEKSETCDRDFIKRPEINSQRNNSIFFN